MPLLIPPCIPPEKLVRVSISPRIVFDENIIMFRTTHFAARKARTIFKSMYSVDAQHGFAQFGMQLIKYRFAQAHRAILNIAAYFPPTVSPCLRTESICAIISSAVAGIGTADNVFFALVNKFLDVFYFNIRCINFANTAYMRSNFDSLCF